MEKNVIVFVSEALQNTNNLINFHDSKYNCHLGGSLGNFFEICAISMKYNLKQNNMIFYPFREMFCQLSKIIQQDANQLSNFFACLFQSFAASMKTFEDNDEYQFSNICENFTSMDICKDAPQGDCIDLDDYCGIPTKRPEKSQWQMVDSLFLWERGIHDLNNYVNENFTYENGAVDKTSVTYYLESLCRGFVRSLELGIQLMKRNVENNKDDCPNLESLVHIMERMAQMDRSRNAIEMIDWNVEKELGILISEDGYINPMILVLAVALRVTFEAVKLST